MQLDPSSAVAAATGFAFLWIIFIGIPSLVIVIMFFVTCSRVRQIRDEARKQTLALQSIRSALVGGQSKPYDYVDSSPEH